jgi:hypothetical protein
MERHGFLSAQGEKLRKEYQERLDARRERDSGLERDFGRERDTDNARDVSQDRQRKPPSLEEVRRQAREDWLKMREEMRDQSREQSRTGGERSRDDDFSL